MHLKSKLFLFALAMTLLVPAVTTAGWGDALKDVGTQLATEKADEMGLSSSDAVSGIKEVLTESADSAVSTLGKAGGFMDNPLAMIPMPDALQGLTGDSGGLVSVMNSAAESVIPDSSSSIMSAIKDLAVPNPTEVASSGGDTSITTFFEEKSRPTLKKVVAPLVDKAMETASAKKYVDTITTALSATGGQAFDINGYVADKTLDGVFSMMGEKEKSIRAAGGGASELLQKLF